MPRLDPSPPILAMPQVLPGRFRCRLFAPASRARDGPAPRCPSSWHFLEDSEQLAPVLLLRVLEGELLVDVLAQPVRKVDVGGAVEAEGLHRDRLVDLVPNALCLLELPLRLHHLGLQLLALERVGGEHPSDEALVGARRRGRLIRVRHLP